MMQFSFTPSSLGNILVAATQRGVGAIFLGDHRDKLVAALRLAFPLAWPTAGDMVLAPLMGPVKSLVEGSALPINLPLDLHGTPFQRRVYEILRTIAVGTTVTYTDVAQRLGLSKGAQAVAGACAANCLAVAVPCHRVVRADGLPSGYRWGLERQRILLKREAMQW